MWRLGPTGGGSRCVLCGWSGPPGTDPGGRRGRSRHTGLGSAFGRGSQRPRGAVLQVGRNGEKPAWSEAPTSLRTGFRGPQGRGARRWCRRRDGPRPCAALTGPGGEAEGLQPLPDSGEGTRGRPGTCTWTRISEKGLGREDEHVNVEAESSSDTGLSLPEARLVSVVSREAACPDTAPFPGRAVDTGRGRGWASPPPQHSPCFLRPAASHHDLAPQGRARHEGGVGLCP